MVEIASKGEVKMCRIHNIIDHRVVSASSAYHSRRIDNRYLALQSMLHQCETP